MANGPRALLHSKVYTLRRSKPFVKRTAIDAEAAIDLAEMNPVIERTDFRNTPGCPTYGV